MRHLDNIDLRLLRIFVTLSEAGSFSAAQIVLNLSQSTLSTHIAALERAFAAAVDFASRPSAKRLWWRPASYLATSMHLERGWDGPVASC
jgi:DNA-binding transcriptional ArsR family regulator